MDGYKKLREALEVLHAPAIAFNSGDTHDPSMVREAIRLGAAVMDYPGITAFQQLLYIQAIQENVGPEYRDYWVFAVAMYQAITHTVVKVDGAAVLVRIAGDDPEWVDKVIDVAAHDDPAAMREWVIELMPVVNQTQWNRITKLLITEDAVKMTKIGRRKLADTLTKKNLTIWIPGEKPVP